MPVAQPPIPIPPTPIPPIAPPSLPPTRPPSLPPAGPPSGDCYDEYGGWDYGKCPEGPGGGLSGDVVRGRISKPRISRAIPSMPDISRPADLGLRPAGNEELIGSTVFSKSRLAQVELALQKPSEAAAFAALVKGSGCPYGEIHFSPIGGQPYSRCQSYEEFIAGYEV